MKRFLVIGAVFCAAAFIGMGVTLFLPATAHAGICVESERQTFFDCADPACTPETPVGMYDCATWHGPPTGGPPCNCQFVRCQLRCPAGW